MKKFFQPFLIFTACSLLFLLSACDDSSADFADEQEGNTPVVEQEPTRSASGQPGSLDAFSDHLLTRNSTERNNAQAAEYYDQGVAFYTFNNGASHLTKLYRLYNAGASDHLYTTSTAEKDTLAGQGWIVENDLGYLYKTGPSNRLALHRFNHKVRGYFYSHWSNNAINYYLADTNIHYEGAACYIDQDSGGGRVPLYQLYNKSSQKYINTSSVNEKNYLTSHGWTYNAVVGYVYESGGSGRVPFYRLYKNGVHLYTASSSERNSLLGQGWVNEGVQCYVYQYDGREPVYRLNSQEGTDHVVTASILEAASLVHAYGYTFEGVIGWAQPNHASGTQPVYKLSRIYLNQNYVPNSEGSVVADLGYELKVSQKYQNKDIYWFGHGANVSYGIPVFNTSNGSYAGLALTYNHNGLKWVILTTRVYSNRDAVAPLLSLFNSPNTTTTSIHNWCKAFVDDGDAYFLNNCTILEKGNGFIVVDRIGKKVVENGHIYNATVSNVESETNIRDHNGNQIVSHDLHVHYNGNNMEFTDVALCFTAGTKIQTDQGLANIEDIGVGDKVLAYDNITDTAVYKEVIKNKVGVVDSIVRLKINGTWFESTLDHPFLTNTGAWTAAGKLSVGEKIKSTKIGSGVIQAKEIIEEQSQVYNIEVAGIQTYCIGEDSFVVHNDCAIANWIQDNVTITMSSFAGVGYSVTFKPRFDGSGNFQYVDVIEYSVGAGVGGGTEIEAGTLKIGAGWFVGATKNFVQAKLGNYDTVEIYDVVQANISISNLLGLGAQLRISDENAAMPFKVAFGSSATLFGVTGDYWYKEGSWDQTGEFVNWYYKVPFTNVSFKPDSGWSYGFDPTVTLSGWGY